MSDSVLHHKATNPYPGNKKRQSTREGPPSMAANRNRELFRVRASRLVDIFPDELVIQEKTVSIIRNEFLVSYVETMPVKDIGRVVYINTPVFAGIRVIGKNTQHELHLKGLFKNQAIKAKEIIEGLLLEDSGVIDVPHWVETDRRRDILAEAGRHPDNQDDLEHRAAE